MSLYDGLGIDDKEGGPKDKKTDVSGWGSSIKMMQSMKALQNKPRGGGMSGKRRGGASLPPVIDLKQARGEELHFDQKTGKLVSTLVSYDSRPESLPPVTSVPFIASEPPVALTGISDEYDPLRPNEYEDFMKRRKEQKNRENREKRREREHERDRDRQWDRDRDRGQNDDRWNGPANTVGRNDRDRDHRDREEERWGAPRFEKSNLKDDRYDEESSPRHYRRRDDRSRPPPPHRNSPDPDGEFEKRKRRREEEEEEDYERPKRAPGGGAAIAPPQSLIEDSPPRPNDMDGVPMSGATLGYALGPNRPSFMGGSVASKIMAKYGYKEGQGLGKKEQGMSTALQVEKTSKRGGKIIHEKDIPKIVEPPRVAINTTDLLKNPSKVILLRNMVGPGEVDDDLEPETAEECTKYGKVVKCVIFEIPNRSDDEAVRIFVEFERMESAIKAIVDLNGRFFGGRVVKAGFYNLDKFRRLDLVDPMT